MLKLNTAQWTVGLWGIAFFVVALSAWITHAMWAITLLMDEKLFTWGKLVLAVLGTVFPPIGVLHGFVLWFWPIVG